MGQVPLWDRYLSGTGTFVGQVPLWDRYLCGTGTFVGQVPLWDRYLSGTGTLVGQVPWWDRYLCGTGTLVGQVPLWDRYLCGSGFSRDLQYILEKLRKLILELSGMVASCQRIGLTAVAFEKAAFPNLEESTS